MRLPTRSLLPTLFVALAVLGAFTAASAQAGALDGARPINMAAVFAGGVSSGDAPGFPVTISEPGSYALTGNLTVVGADDTAIEISSDDVTIDLRGFRIAGPVTCFGGGGFGTSCSASGTGDGIQATGFVRHSIRGGTITGFGDRGVDISGTCRLHQLTVSHNGGGGIEADAACMLRDVRVVLNGGDGVAIPDTALVVDSIFEGNGIDGVRVDHVLLRNTIVSGNGGHGMLADYALVQKGSYSSNGGDGIDVLIGFLSDITVSQNVGYGLVAGPPTAHLRTILNGNQAAISGSPRWFGWSLCDGSFGCF